MELSNQYDHAWLNGSNEYITSVRLTTMDTIATY